MINHYESLAQAEAAVRKGTDGRAELTRTLERHASTGKAQAWGRQEPGEPTYSSPNISYGPSHVTPQVMSASASAVFAVLQQKNISHHKPCGSVCARTGLASLPSELSCPQTFFGIPRALERKTALCVAAKPHPPPRRHFSTLCLSTSQPSAGKATHKNTAAL